MEVNSSSNRTLDGKGVAQNDNECPANTSPLLPAPYDVGPGGSDQETQAVCGVRSRFIEHLQVSGGDLAAGLSASETTVFKRPPVIPPTVR